MTSIKIFVIVTVTVTVTATITIGVTVTVTVRVENSRGTLEPGFHEIHKLKQNLWQDPRIVMS